MLQMEHRAVVFRFRRHLSFSNPEPLLIIVCHAAESIDDSPLRRRVQVERDPKSEVELAALLDFFEHLLRFSREHLQYFRKLKAQVDDVNLVRPVPDIAPV